MSPVLSIDNISVSLERAGQKPQEILHSVSCSISSRERVALIGSNGAGKSTLLKTIVRLHEPSEGELSLLGDRYETVHGRKLRKVRSKIGFIFQHHNLVKELCVLSNVIHGAIAQQQSARFWYQSFASHSVRIRAIEKLKMVGCDHLCSAKAHALSGGQSQRVAVARALMQDPSVILADEPTASLDPASATEVMESLSSLSVPLLFTTHNLDHVQRYATRVIALNKGTIVYDGDPLGMTEQRAEELYDA